MFGNSFFIAAFGEFNQVSKFPLEYTGKHVLKKDGLHVETLISMFTKSLDSAGILFSYRYVRPTNITIRLFKCRKKKLVNNNAHCFTSSRRTRVRANFS